MVQNPGKMRTEKWALDIVIKRSLVLGELFYHDRGKEIRFQGVKT